MKNRYRIVRDAYLGYEAQVSYWWLPFFWFQMGFANTHSSVGEAERYIRRTRREVVKEVRHD